MFTSAYRLRQLIRNKEVSPVELTKDLLSDIEAMNPELHAFIKVTPEEAIKTAKDIEKLKDKEKLLLGIPIAISDSLQLKGTPTTMGSVLLADKIAQNDCLNVERLKSAGAIILGKTNMAEFGMSSITANRLAEQCRNPWDTSFSTGGAEGGTAAVVAGGLAPIAIGSDKCGSMRLPASFCGNISLKATRGRIPLVRPYLLNINDKHLYQLGITARYVRDIAMLLDVTSQHDPRDKECVRSKDFSFEDTIGEDLQQQKIAFSTDLDFIQPDVEITSSIKQALNMLESLDHKVEEARIGLTQDIMRHFCNLFSVDHYIPIVSLFSDDQEKYNNLSDYVRHWLDYGREVSGVAFSVALTYQQWLSNTINELFDKFDILITPTSPFLPFHINNLPKDIYHSDVLSMSRLWSYTLPFNITGHPAITMPCGFDKNNMPIGLQIIGKYFSEKRLLQVAGLLEVALGLTTKKPQIKTVKL